jgi:DUF4097 and DUF4098 domain-containing protein YvlB
MKSLIPLSILAAALIAAGIALANNRAPVVYHHQWTLAAHPDGRVVLKLDNQDVRMRVTQGNKVAVNVTVRGDPDDKQDLIKRYRPSVEARGTDVMIHSPHHHHTSHWFSFANRSSALVEVELPRKMAVRFDLDSGDFSFTGADDRAPIKGKVDSGDIDIQSASRTLDLDADSGDVRVTLSQPAERVAIEADSGSIHVKGGANQLKADADSGDITASGSFGNARLKADSGDIRVSSLHGSLRADADSGDVTASWQKLDSDARIDIEADSGDIRVTLPADAQLNGVVEADGDINSDFQGDYNEDHDRLELKGPAGATPVRIESESGDVDLRKHD